MNLLQRYRTELAKEREGDSRAFARMLQIGDKVFYIFVGLSIAMLLFGFYEAERVPIGSGQAKALAIFFGFFASVLLLLFGMFIRVIFYLVFTDRKRSNG